MKTHTDLQGMKGKAAPPAYPPFEIVIKGFETDMVGNYYIVLSGQRDKYSAKVILEKVNESRRKRGLPEFVID